MSHLTQIEKDQGYSRILPRACKQKLDAEGVIRGKTWRHMSGGSYRSQEIRAMNWFFWKRGIDLNDRHLTLAQRARRDALMDMGGEEVVA